MRVPPNGLSGLATGIGSMPFTDPGDAPDLIFTYFQDPPHWPQLPRRGEAEGLVSQHLAPLLKRDLVAFRPNGIPYFRLDNPRWERRFLDYCELLPAGEDAGESDEFVLTEENAAGFSAFLDRCVRSSSDASYLKGQIAGPLTAGFRITDTAGAPWPGVSFLRRRGCCRRLLLFCSSFWEHRWRRW